MSIKDSEALSNLPIINFFRDFYFHRSSVSKSQSLELPFIFKKKSCMFCLERLQQVQLLFFFKCYATKQDLFKPG